MAETYKSCILCGGNFMQINLSEETIKTVYKALKSERNTLNCITWHLNMRKGYSI